MTQPNPFPFQMSSIERKVLEMLATEHKVTQTDILRRALRLFINADERIKKGETLAFIDKEGKIHKMIISGCGDVNA